METIFSDMLPNHKLDYAVIVARMIGAVIFGGLIGYERERHDSAAGLRTHILVSLAAALFAIISIESAHMTIFAADRIQIDPLRVIEAVTAGVAFLAAGMIILSKGEVRGLTTGAGLWLSGGIGLGLGFGFWVMSVFASILCFVILGLIGRLTAKIKE